MNTITLALSAAALLFAVCATTFAAESAPTPAGQQSPIAWDGSQSDYHGFVCHNFEVDGCSALVVEPKEALPGRPWVWRTMFWDAFPNFDIVMLGRGYHVAFMDVGNTFGCPDAMKHFDAFYALLTTRYKLSKHPALEGLSRGGLYAYRWAYVNTHKVGCIYGDAPVCDMKSWPGGKGKGLGSPGDWQAAIQAYHFSGEPEMMRFDGNPIDILAPISAAHIPIIHVVGDSDSYVPESENTDIVRERYMKLGGQFVLIVKQGCDHHPHGLTDPTPVVNFVIAHTAGAAAARQARGIAPKAGTVITLTHDQWQ
jgi:hypothetical protein